jgi:hypothetical protein
MDAPIGWLVEGEPFVEYRTRRDLLGESEDDPAVRAARRAMLADPRVTGLVAELSAWPGKVIASHKSAGQPFHKLTFVADLGLDRHDPGVAAVVSRILAHRSEEGPFALAMNITPSHGGSGADEWAWALCDAPLVVYGLAKLGLADDPAVRAAIAYLTGLVRENGWPCAVSERLGGFRGPGRKDDPCPFATLAMLKALAAFDDLRDSPASRDGAESLLTLWRDSRDRHPYMFYMGTDFRKLKAPFVWYDLLHVLDVLSVFPWLRTDARLLDMVGTLERKADAAGRFTPESVWTAWKGWEFAQKKEPSRWVTMLAWRILGRASDARSGQGAPA